MNRINKRDIKLSDCHVSNAKYNELKYFCKQYHEKKEELKNCCRQIEPINNGTSGKVGSTNLNEKSDRKDILLRKDITMIEETAKEAGENISPWLIKSVTEGIPYEWMDIPLSRTKFYDARRYFFYLLAQKR